MTDDPNELKLVQGSIQNELAFSPADSTEKAWMNAFTEQVNNLILHDFNKLILILYRLDISETKLRRALNDQQNLNNFRTAETICELIIERQIQKVRIRQQHRGKHNIGEDEKW